MLGKAHTYSGAAAWMLSAPLLSATMSNWTVPFTDFSPGFTLTPATYAAGAAVAMGAALAPDLDHPSASYARNALPPVTTAISNAVHAAGSGHRTLTHSWLGLLLMGALISIPTFFAMQGGTGSIGYIIVGAILTFMLTFVLHALKLPPVRKYGNAAFILGKLAVAIGASIFFLTLSPDLGWVAAAVIIGYFTHMLGDLITTEGIPLKWPFSTWKTSLSPMRAGGFTEIYLLTPLFFAAVVAAAVMVWGTGPVGWVIVAMIGVLCAAGVATATARDTFHRLLVIPVTVIVMLVPAGLVWKTGGAGTGEVFGAPVDSR